VAVLLLSSLIGLAFIAGTAFVFFRFGWKSLSAIIPVTAGIAFAAYTSNGGGSGEYALMVFSPSFTGVVAGYCFRSMKSLQFFAILTSAVIGIALSGNYFYQKMNGGMDLLQDTRQRAVEFFSQAQMDEREREESLAKLDASLELLKDVMPFAYFLNALSTALIGYFLARALLRRTVAAAFEAAPGLELFRLHDYLIFGLIGSWLAVLLLNPESYSVPYIAGLNLALCLSSLYLLQAVGIAKFVMGARNIPPFVLPLALTVVVILGAEFIMFFSIVLLSIGALDFWADFRKLEAKSKN
jgi:uncharacterized protein YybS (DUF2232 family)